MECLSVVTVVIQHHIFDYRYFDCIKMRRYNFVVVRQDERTRNEAKSHVYSTPIPFLHKVVNLLSIQIRFISQISEKFQIHRFVLCCMWYHHTKNLAVEHGGYCKPQKIAETFLLYAQIQFTLYTRIISCIQSF